jgi:hypothetical protein
MMERVLFYFRHIHSQLSERVQGAFSLGGYS